MKYKKFLFAIMCAFITFIWGGLTFRWYDSRAIITDVPDRAVYHLFTVTDGVTQHHGLVHTWYKKSLEIEYSDNTTCVMLVPFADTTIAAIPNIHPPKTKNFLLFPNPFTDSFFVYASDFVTIRLFDVAGRFVSEFKASPGVGIPKIADLPAGTYFYTVVEYPNEAGKITRIK